MGLAFPKNLVSASCQHSIFALSSPLIVLVAHYPRNCQFKLEFAREMAPAAKPSKNQLRRAKKKAEKAGKADKAKVLYTGYSAPRMSHAKIS